MTVVIDTKMRTTIFIIKRGKLMFTESSAKNIDWSKNFLLDLFMMYDNYVIYMMHGKFLFVHI